jgi:hypothetical protein
MSDKILKTAGARGKAYMAKCDGLTPTDIMCGITELADSPAISGLEKELDSLRSQTQGSATSSSTLCSARRRRRLSRWLPNCTIRMENEKLKGSIRMTYKTDSFEDRVQEFAKDLGAKRVEYMGFETKIVYALAIDEIGSLRSQLADARQRNIKLNEMLGKAQSRDSNTTNKKLRKEIGHKDEVIKWLAIHAEHINRLQPSGCYMVNFKFLEKPEDWIEAAEEAIKTK